MEARKEALTIKEMNYNEKVAKVSIVGAGMLSNPGVAATMFESEQFQYQYQYDFYIRDPYHGSDR